MSAEKERYPVLLYRDILERLERGEIFYPGTWDRANVRTTGYDLRMAWDDLIIPDVRSPTRASKRFDRGQRCPAPVELKPGEAAFVTTRESVCMPWNLFGNTGGKFSLVMKGVLILTGLFVAPGYGLRLSDGEWRTRRDERLHFLLSNIGPESVLLNPGQTPIASIMFFEVDVPEELREEIPPYAGLGDPHTSNVEFFTRITELERHLGDRIDEVHQQLSNQRQEINQNAQNAEASMGELDRDMKRQFGALETRLGGFGQGLVPVTLFGVYLLAVTLAGVTTAILFSVLERYTLDKNDVTLAVCVVVALTILIGLGLILYHRRRMADIKSRNQQQVS